MAAEIALAIQEQTDCKPYVICSKENEETIAAYKDKIVLLEMPKKGGVGLREALGGAVRLLAELKTKVNNDFSKRGDRECGV